MLTKGGKLTASKGEACEQQSTSSRARGAPSHPSQRHKPDEHTSCSYLHAAVETICTVCPGTWQWMLLSRWKQASFELMDGEGPHRASSCLLWSSGPQLTASPGGDSLCSVLEPRPISYTNLEPSARRGKFQVSTILLEKSQDAFACPLDHHWTS